MFATAVFLAAFLLFAVQPLAGRVLLPHFGGAPAVWTTCLMFFQVALFAGYLWIHAGARRLRPWALTVVHLVIVCGGLLCLPVAEDPHNVQAGMTSPTTGVLSWLAGSVLLPYFILATTAPLLQTWYAALHGPEPYHLYAISNAGSLLGVATYPFLVEPNVPVPAQRIAFGVGFTVFAVLSVVIAVRWARAGQKATPTPSHRRIVAVTGAKEAAAWIPLAALPVLLLIAITNHLTVDVAAGPFLWMPPLFVYLLSFVLVFWRSEAVPPTLLAWLWAASTIAMGANLLLSGKAGLGSQLLVSLGVLWTGSMLCHAELARRRPATDSMTMFYVCIAGGGAIGGLAGGWLAPRLFLGFHELHVGVFGIFFLLLFLRTRRKTNPLHRAARLERLGLYLGVGSALPAMAASLYLWTRTDLGGAHVQERRRNFFGTLQVTRQDAGPQGFGGEYTVLTHGRIQHGMQWNDPARRTEPTMYFGRTSAVGCLLSQAGSPRRIGVLGLGVGTLAAYARPGDAITFFEIDPDVADLARTQFSYLASTKGRVDIVIGDGRAALAATDARFDVLVLDAFSSDAVPVHLLTLEAFALYQQRLTPEGRIVANVSNRHLAVERVVAGAAEKMGWAFSVFETPGDPAQGLAKVRWAVMLQRRAASSGFPLGLTPASLAGAPVLWTDARSSLLPLL